MASRASPRAGPPDTVATARRLLRAVPTASLATAAETLEGWPYASLVAMANTQDGTPVLLLSDLSDHTRNLRRDERASLLLDTTAGLANRLAGARLTLLGRVRLIDEPQAETAARERFLRRHPGARAYADFADFACYALSIEHAHLVLGFGRAYQIDGRELPFALPTPDPMAIAEAGLLAQLNGEGRTLLQHLARGRDNRTDRTWRATGVDRLGVDLKAGGEVMRCAFDRAIEGPSDVLGALETVADIARERRAEGN